MPTLPLIYRWTILITLLGGWATHAAATEQRCPFTGEVYRAKSYKDIVLFRGGNPQKKEAVRRHTPLYHRDVLRVLGNQVVEIRDQPGEQLRVIGPEDGEVTIKAPRSCKLDEPGWYVILTRIADAFSAEIDGAVAPEATVTLPARSAEGDTGGETRIELPLLPRQYLSSDVDRITVVWGGPSAHASIAGGADQILSAESDWHSWISAQPVRPLLADETLELSVVSLRDPTNAQRVKIRVTAPGKAPRPEGIASVANLSPAERTLYALWLYRDGPPEWRLQALSLLQSASEDNYMAWKLWRAITAHDGALLQPR